MKNKKIAVIHTTPLTVETLKNLALEIIGDVEIVNLVDDSILPELVKSGGNLDVIKERWGQYARIAEGLGVDCILNACSSVGEMCEIFQPEIKVPLLRIDEAMAEKAVKSAKKIGVAATLETTMNPTQRLLKNKAENLGKDVEFVPVVASSAYDKLINGDKAGHDAELLGVLRELLKEVEIVVLAQASMARVVSSMSEEEQRCFLTSPILGMQKVKELINQK